MDHPTENTSDTSELNHVYYWSGKLEPTVMTRDVLLSSEDAKIHPGNLWLQGDVEDWNVFYQDKDKEGVGHRNLVVTGRYGGHFNNITEGRLEVGLPFSLGSVARSVGRLVVGVGHPYCSVLVREKSELIAKDNTYTQPEGTAVEIQGLLEFVPYMLDGTLTISGEIRQYEGGEMRVNSGGVLVLGEGVTYTIPAGGVLKIRPGSLVQQLPGSEIIMQGWMNIGQQHTIPAGASVRLQRGGEIYLAGLLTVQGTLTLDEGAAYTVDPAKTLPISGTLTQHRDSVLEVKGSIVLSGRHHVKRGARLKM
jgi:hypothetical protein